MKVALVDVDDVLTNFTATVMGMQGNGKTTEGDVTNWDFLSFLHEQDKSSILDRLNDPFFWQRTLKPREDALRFGDILRSFGYDRIEIVTSPWSKAVIAARAEWLYQHFASQFDAVHFQKHKDRVMGHMMIDDRASNIHCWKEKQSTVRYVGSVLFGLLFTRPHNHEEKKLTRASDWSDVKTQVLRRGITDVVLNASGYSTTEAYLCGKFESEFTSREEILEELELLKEQQFIASGNIGHVHYVKLYS